MFCSVWKMEEKHADITTFSPRIYKPTNVKAKTVGKSDYRKKKSCNYVFTFEETELG